MHIGIVGAGMSANLDSRPSTSVIKSLRQLPWSETLASLAAEAGAKPVVLTDAARSGELVIVTIPMKNISMLPRGLFKGVGGDLVVVDRSCNYYPQQRDGRIAEIEGGLPESKWVSQQLSRPVIKTFNNIYAQHLMDLGKPKGAPKRIALPVAGDDDASKAIVLHLVDRIGFRWCGFRHVG